MTDANMSELRFSPPAGAPASGMPSGADIYTDSYLPPPVDRMLNF
jgi:hypothetical protein